MLKAARRLAQRALDLSNTIQNRSIPIGHGYSLEVGVDDASFSVELGVTFPFPWGGDRDHGGRPIMHYLGGLTISLGELVITDHGRDTVFHFGRNLLSDLAFSQ